VETVTHQAERVAQGCASLFGELHRILQTVGSASRFEEGRLDSTQRLDEMETVRLLLAELQQDAPAALPRDIPHVHTPVPLALPHLLRFPQRLDALQAQVTAHVGPQAISLIAWAWQRREILSQKRQELLEGFHLSWRSLAAELLQARDVAGRASRAVEHWHSMGRPHLSVHRTLSTEMLALLAVWQNHRVAP
jgi:hypothetical protein